MPATVKILAFADKFVTHRDVRFEARSAPRGLERTCGPTIDSEPPSLASGRLISRQGNNLRKCGEAILEVALMFPLGSEPGAYEVQLLDSQLRSLASGRGEGTVENYVTTVRVTLDLQQVPSGSHQLAVRRGDDQWRFFAARVE